MIKIVDTYDLYHVVFASSNYSHWVFRFLDPNFQHCYIIGESYGGQYWRVINGRRSHLQVDVEPKSLYPTIKDYCEEGSTVVTVQADININRSLQFFNIFTCVDVVKAVLGINSFFIWTPKQLYRRLKNGRYA